MIKIQKHFYFYVVITLGFLFNWGFTNQAQALERPHNFVQRQISTGAAGIPLAPDHYEFAFGTTGAGNGQFNLPTGVAVDSAGNIWAADRTNGTIQKFDSYGVYILSATPPVSLTNIENIATDSSANIYVVDSGTDAVYKFASDGVHQASSTLSLTNPLDVLVVASTVYVLDTSNIFALDSSLANPTTLLSSGLGTPQGLAADSAGNLYVTDSSTATVLKYDSGGTFLTSFALTNSDPRGMAIDQSTGTIYVADSVADTIEMLNSSGTNIGMIASSGSTLGQVNAPLDIALSANNKRLVVADSGNDRIEVFCGGACNISFSDPDTNINPDMKLGAYGFPVVTYYNATDTSLHIAFCGDSNCDHVDDYEVDNTGDVGLQSSLSFRKNTIPMIAYYDQSNGNLKLARCESRSTCASPTIVTVAAGNMDNMGLSPAMVINWDAVYIAYYNATTTKLNLVSCNAGVLTCNSTIIVLDTVTNNPHPAILLNTGGTVSVAYEAWTSSTASTLKLFRCNNVSCTSISNNVVDSTSTRVSHPAVTKNSSGNPVVAYVSEAPNPGLYLATCADTKCIAGTTINPIAAGTTGFSADVQIAQTGFPVISYHDTSADNLELARCNDVLCSSAAISTIDSRYDTGQVTSLQLDVNDDPIISYFNNPEFDLRLYLPRDTAQCFVRNAATGLESRSVGHGAVQWIHDYSSTLATHQLLVAGTCTGVSEWAGGSDKSTLNLSKSIEIIGGYNPNTGQGDPDWSSSNPTTYPTILQAATTNTTINQGRVVQVSGTTSPRITLTNIIIRNGNTSSYGGGIFIESGARVTLDNSKVQSNISSGGGGISTAGQLTIRNGSLIGGVQGSTGNQATGAGGIYVNNNSPVIIDNSTISGNIAQNAGGGIYSIGPSLTIQNGSLIGGSQNTTGNKAGSGGGLYIGHGTLLIDASTVSGNTTSSNDGGGIYSTGTLTIRNNSVIGGSQADGTGNRTAGGASGAGLYINSWYTTTISATTISGNTTTSTNYTVWGGGIYKTGAGTLLINNSLIGGIKDSTGNKAAQGGGIYLNQGTTIIDGTSISGNEATGTLGGGGLYNAATLTLQNNSTIGGSQADGTGNVASGSGADGGGLYINSTTTTTISATTISGNTATNGTTSLGGGIYKQNTGALLINSNSIIGGLQNTTGNVSYTGGGIASIAGAVTLDASTVSGNTAIGATGGGGIYSTANLTLQNNSTIGGSQADGTGNNASASDARGGGIYSTATATLNNSTVSGNTLPLGTATYGGGIYSTGTLQLNSSRIGGSRNTTGNLASQGGGLYLAAGVVTLNATTVSGNEATGAIGGGGIYSASTLTIQNGSLIGGSQADNTGNVASASAADGGGIYIASSTASTISASTVSGNTATNGAGAIGGGIYKDGSGSLTIQSASVIGGSLNTTGNEASDGAGIAHNNGALIIATSTISGNESLAALGRAGLYSLGGTVTITDSTISSNIGSGTDSTGAGLYISNSGTNNISSTTISANTVVGANSAGAGLVKAGTGSLSLENVTISANMSGAGGAALLLNGGTLTLNYGTVANNVSSGDVNDGIRQVTGTLNIKNSIIAYNGSLTDNLGTENCSGTITDNGGNYTNANSDCTFSNADDSTLILRALMNNGGNTATHELLAGHAIEGGGVSSCPATDQRGFSRPLDANADTIPVCDAGAYEVAEPLCFIESNGDNITDFYSLYHTALQDAVNAASNGATLKIAGICTGVSNENDDSVNETLYLEKNLTLIGGYNPNGISPDWTTSDPSSYETILQPATSNSTSNQGRVVYVEGSTNSVVTLRGLTLRNGNTTGNGGGILVESGATLTLNNSKVQSSISSNAYVIGGGGGIYSAGALNILNGSLIGGIQGSTGNQATGSGGDGAGLYILSSRATTMSASTISGNTASTGNTLGGGIYKAGSGTLDINSASRIGGIKNSTGNQATAGGGLYISSGSGVVTLDGSTVSGNEALGTIGGGGIYSQATLTITASTIGGLQGTTGNSVTGSGGDGGGIYINSSSASLLNASTVSGNTATNGSSATGGGVFKTGTGSLSLENVTLSANSAGADGGALASATGTSNLSYVTVANNTTTNDTDDGIFRSSGTLNLANSIIAYNGSLTNHAGSDNCKGTITDNGGNYTNDLSSCNFTNADDATLNLGFLTNNGGASASHQLLSGMAIDGATGTCPSTDQLGVARPATATDCDAGAYETDFVALCFVESTGDAFTDFASADHRAVQLAVNAATAGDTLKIAGLCTGFSDENSDSFKETLFLEKNLTLIGGYNPNNGLVDWTTSDPATYETILQPATTNSTSNKGRVVYVEGSTSPIVTLIGITFRNGNITGNGGGLFIENGANVTLDNSKVQSSKASSLGGGIANVGTLHISNGSLIGGVLGSTGNISLNGGGIYNNSTLTLSASTVRGNTANAAGGGIYSSAALTVTGSVVSDNSALSAGGGISSYAALIIENGSLIADNQVTDSDGMGGGLYINTVAVTLIRATTISGNQALYGTDAFGGGIAKLGNGNLNLENVTLSANAAGTEGGALYSAAGTNSLNYVTIANNTGGSGAGIYGIASTLTLANSIIAYNGSLTDNVGTANCGGFFSDGGGNYTNAGSNCGFGNADDSNLSLGALADNGGTSKTHALLAGNAIDGAGFATCPSTDQRGTARPSIIAACDAGAYEITPQANLCFAELIGATTTHFASIDHSALQQAVDASISGYTLKIAGVCTGTSSGNGSGSTETLYLDRNLTIIGGYNPNGGNPDWTTSNPSIYQTILQAAKTNSTSNQGRVIYVDGSSTRTVSLTGLTIRNGNTSAEGAGIFSGVGARLTINNSKIQSNISSSTIGGGGIYSLGLLTLQNGSLVGGLQGSTGNQVTGVDGDGAGIYINNYGTNTISNSIVSGNTTSIGTTLGGGIYKEGSSRLDILNGSVIGGIKDSTGNRASMGGGLYIFTGGIVTINGSTVSGNEATYASGAGAGVYTRGTLTILYSTIGGSQADGTGNVATAIDASGGGIFVSSTSATTITGSTVSGNSVPNGDLARGGGIYKAISGSLLINGGTIGGTHGTTGNVAGSGGGLYLETGTVTLDNATVSGNEARSTTGGGIYNGTTLIIQNGSVIGGDQGTTGNVVSNSSGNAGGIYSNGTTTIKASTISGNVSAGSTGGIYQASSSTLSLENVTISGNTGVSLGGGLTQENGTTNLNYVTVANNTSSGGTTDGIYRSGGTLAVMNSIIAYNGSLTDNVGTDNCSGIITDNGGNYSNASSDCTFSNANDSTLRLGALANNSGASKTQALLLGTAIDGGGVTSCPLTDQRGFSRPLDANADTIPVCDAGAYEVAEPLCFIEANGDNITDFYSIDHSALQAAVNAASSGATLKIAGICTGASSGNVAGSLETVYLNKNLTLIGGYNPNGTSPNWSSSNPTVYQTILQPATSNSTSNQGRVVYVEGSTGTVVTLTGLTFRNGNTIGNGGGMLIESGATVTLNNSKVQSSISSNVGTISGGGGIYSAGALNILNGSLIGGIQGSTGNRATGSGGDGAGLYLLTAANTLIKESTISGNQAVTSVSSIGGAIVKMGNGTLSLENVTISANAAGGNGGALYHSQGTTNLSYVTIANNTSSNDTHDGIYRSAGTLNVSNSIIAYNGSLSNNVGTDNCAGVIIDNGGNYTNASDCSFSNAADVGLSLGALANNGGSTETHLVLAGKAIEGAQGTCPTTDQRGTARPVTACDSGAYENPILPVCFVETNGDSITDFASVDHRAVQLAVNAAASGNTLKIAGTCTGVSNENDDSSNETLYLWKNVTLMGGYNTNGTSPLWSSSNPAAYETILQPATSNSTSNQGRVVYVEGNGSAGAVVTLTGLTLRNGNTTGNGGGMLIESGATVTLNNSRVQSSISSNVNLISGGGGIYSAGALNILNGSLIGGIQGSTGNRATGSGGDGAGLYLLTSANTLIKESTISGNETGTSAASTGGAIVKMSSGTLSLENVTISANTAGGNGGALYHSQGTTNLSYVTIANNTSSNDTYDGIYRSAGTLNVSNSIIAYNGSLSDNTGTDNCNGVIIDNGGNYTNATSDCSFSNADDVTLSLGALANNGGTVQTHQLLAGQAIDGAGAASYCPTTDERGTSRPVVVTDCDAGAYESTLSAISASGSTVGGLPGSSVVSTLLSPLGQQTASSFTYEWSAARDSDTYTLRVDGTGNPNVDTVDPVNQTYVDVRLDATNICSRGICRFDPNINLPVGHYKWWIQPANSQVVGQWSPPSQFRVVDPVVAPQPYSPAGIIQDAHPSYLWYSDSSIHWYQLWIVETYTGTVVYNQWHKTTDICFGVVCSVQPNIILASGQRYEWWLQAERSQVYSSWTGPTYFYVDLSSNTNLVPEPNQNNILIQPVVIPTAIPPLDPNEGLPVEPIMTSTAPPPPSEPLPGRGN